MHSTQLPFQGLLQQLILAVLTKHSCKGACAIKISSCHLSKVIIIRELAIHFEQVALPMGKHPAWLEALRKLRLLPRMLGTGCLHRKPQSRMAKSLLTSLPFYALDSQKLV